MEIILIALLIGLYIMEFLEKRKLRSKIEELNTRKCEKACEKKPKKVEMTKEKKKEMEKAKKAFNNLMEYDENVALGNKRK